MKIENIFYPPALCIATHSSSQPDSAPKALESSQATHVDTLPTTSKTSKEPNRAGTKGKEKESAQAKVLKPVKLLPSPKETSKENEAT